VTPGEQPDQQPIQHDAKAVIWIVVGAAWVGAMALLTTWSYTDGAIVAAVVLTFLAAVVIGNWWVLAVPLVPATTMIAGALLSGSESDYHGWTGFAWAAYIAVIAAALVALMALGVGINQLLTRAWQRHPLSQAGRAQ